MSRLVPQKFVLDGDKPSDFSNEDAVDIPVNSTEVDSDNSKPSVDTDEQTVPSIQFTWLGWFEHVKKGNKSAAEDISPRASR